MIKQLITSIMNNSVTEDQPVCFPGNIWPCQLESGSITGLKILFLELISQRRPQQCKSSFLTFHTPCLGSEQENECSAFKV